MSGDGAGHRTGDRDALAREVAAAMWAEDRASRWLGMELIEIGAGRAVLRMPVRPEMANGHGIGHGGITFALADSAFAFACNSHNRATVAAAAEVRFRAPVQLGDVLVATAVERSLVGRDGIYDVRVTRSAAPGGARPDPTGEVVAEFVGRSRCIGGPVLDRAVGSGEDPRQP